MGSTLTKEQIEDLLIYCGTQPTFWRDDDMLVNCPVHGESNPSMGVNVEKQVCHCFSCGFKGTFTKLLYNSLPDEFGYDSSTQETQNKTWFRADRKAREFLSSRYELEYREIGEKLKRIKRYEDVLAIPDFLSDENKSIPMYKIAPFMSGKETYKYFFNRGFTKEDMTKYMIGRDLEHKTVTIPVFNVDGTLAGVIGRYISKKRKHNQRYKIYDNFDRGSLLYPLNYYEPFEDTIIIIEGQFDAIHMHKCGFTNSLSLMTNEMTKIQAKWLEDNCECVIYIGDNDDRGLQAREKNRKLLGNKVNFKLVDYPEHGKDPCDWSIKEIEDMIATAHSPLVRRLSRM